MAYCKSYFEVCCDSLKHLLLQGNETLQYLSSPSTLKFQHISFFIVFLDMGKSPLIPFFANTYTIS